METSDADNAALQYVTLSCVYYTAGMFNLRSTQPYRYCNTHSITHDFSKLPESKSVAGTKCNHGLHIALTDS